MDRLSGSTSTIPRDAEPVLVVLLLGVVTDYAVFFLHGMRERLAAGDERACRRRSVRRPQYLPIVVTAGLIVAGGTASLVAGELDFFRAFGPGMALTVLIALARRGHARAGADRDPRPARSSGPAPPRSDLPRERPSARRRTSRRRGRSRSSSLWSRSRASWSPAADCSRPNLGLTQIVGLPERLGAARRRAGGGGRASRPASSRRRCSSSRASTRRCDLPGLVRLERVARRRAGRGGVDRPGQRGRPRRCPGSFVADRRRRRPLPRRPRRGAAGRPARSTRVERLRERLPSLLAATPGLPDARVSSPATRRSPEETVETITHDLASDRRSPRSSSTSCCWRCSCARSSRRSTSSSPRRSPSRRPSA